MVAAVTSSSSASSSTALSSASTSAQAQTDRFLKLLVAQLSNQDPMNPMDNAQMTSQIAQINTVSGIQQLNDTIKSMSAQYTSMQVMQGAAMIGHQVVADGNTMSVNAGAGTAAVSLDTDATNVQVQVITPGGQVIDQFDMGALAAGTHNINWDASKYTGSGAPTFTVTAKQGSASVTATPLVRDTIASVGTDSSGAMNLALKGGTSIKYDAIKSIL
ncbi:flagellar biosynthesis protein FlgD [Rhodoferax lacus]|uniref:Basal-body rod modification protein FlgD n=1 Tax=Rhodoferax lacus TaxID=2184758 RepID=A0A3E1R6V9_9BURK|nr:flagellar hook capping FlgD N-terminal domain-containing protein [Rhodoferax lacus]RFO95047.1 flagellar biosynthesis protein FlgD [Rhodoferax lacus]